MENHSKRQREDESQPSGNQQKPTVCFNVGGKIYEVSRSLLEQYPDTMLARMASDTWLPAGNDSDDNGEKRTKDDNGGNDDEDGDEDEDDDDDKSNKSALFIERDGDRFKFCLDYMRDGGIIGLPPTVSKEALLQDLAYYGFQDVDPSGISIEEPTVKACYQRIISLADDFGHKAWDAEKNSKAMELVAHLLRFYCTGFGGTSQKIRIDKKFYEKKYCIANELSYDYCDDKSHFVKHLKGIGLKCKNVEIQNKYNPEYVVFHLELL